MSTDQYGGVDGEARPAAELDHLGWLVPDVDACRAELAGLGFPVGPIEEWEREDSREAYVGTWPKVLLMQPRSERGPLAAHVARRGWGLHHLGVHVTGLPSLLRGLRRWLVCPSTFRTMARGGPAWLVRPAEGLLAELQPAGDLHADAPADPTCTLEVDGPDPGHLRDLLAAIGLDARAVCVREAPRWGGARLRLTAETGPVVLEPARAGRPHPSSP